MCALSANVSGHSNVFVKDGINAGVGGKGCLVCDEHLGRWFARKFYFGRGRKVLFAGRISSVEEPVAIFRIGQGAGIERAEDPVTIAGNHVVGGVAEELRQELSDDCQQAPGPA